MSKKKPYPKEKCSPEGETLLKSEAEEQITYPVEGAGITVTMGKKEARKGIVSRLTREEVKVVKQQYGMWLGLPDAIREQKSQAEFAKDKGVSPSVLSRWNKDPIVLQAKEGALRMFYSSGDKIKLFMDSIETGLKKGSPATQRLFAEMAGLLDTKKQGVQSIDFNVSYGEKDSRD